MSTEPPGGGYRYVVSHLVLAAFGVGEASGLWALVGVLMIGRGLFATGQMLGPLVAGMVVDATGSLGLALLAGAAVALVGAGASLALTPLMRAATRAATL
jgi:hypothetical protein